MLNTFELVEEARSTLIVGSNIEAAGPAEEELYGVVIRDYHMNILLLMSGMTLLNLAAIVGIYFWPEVFIRGGGHVVFATIQTIAFLGYLITSYGSLRQWLR